MRALTANGVTLHVREDGDPKQDEFLARAKSCVEVECEEAALDPDEP